MDGGFGPEVSNGPNESDLDRFGDCQRVFHLNAKIQDGAIHLGMAQQKLNRAQVTSLAVNVRNLRSAHRVRPVGGRIELDGFHSLANQPGILARRDVEPFVEPARR